MTTFSIISHIHNEPEYLPYFVEHYKDRVDKAVILDDGSTDQTGLDYVREHAPEWTILRRESDQWDAPMIDHICRSIERQIEGWVLTVTVDELIIPDRKELMENLELIEEDFIFFNGYQMIQKVEEIFDPNIGFVEQFNWGIPEIAVCRMMHRNQNKEDWEYIPGRHELYWNNHNGDWRNKNYKGRFGPCSLWRPILCDFKYCPRDISFQRRLVDAGRVGTLDAARGYGGSKVGLTQDNLVQEFNSLYNSAIKIK